MAHLPEVKRVLGQYAGCPPVDLFYDPYVQKFLLRFIQQNSSGTGGFPTRTEVFSNTTNPIITLSTNFIAGSVKVFRGTRLTVGQDYNETAPNKVTLTSSPDILDVFTIDYQSLT